MGWEEEVRPSREPWRMANLVRNRMNGIEKDERRGRRVVLSLSFLISGDEVGCCLERVYQRHGLVTGRKEGIGKSNATSWYCQA